MAGCSSNFTTIGLKSFNVANSWGVGRPLSGSLVYQPGKPSLGNSVKANISPYHNHNLPIDAYSVRSTHMKSYINVVSAFATRGLKLFRKSTAPDNSWIKLAALTSHLTQHHQTASHPIALHLLGFKGQPAARAFEFGAAAFLNGLAVEGLFGYKSSEEQSKSDNDVTPGVIFFIAIPILLLAIALLLYWEKRAQRSQKISCSPKIANSTPSSKEKNPVTSAKKTKPIDPKAEEPTQKDPPSKQDAPKQKRRHQKRGHGRKRNKPWR